MQETSNVRGENDSSSDKNYLTRRRHVARVYLCFFALRARHAGALASLREKLTIFALAYSNQRKLQKLNSTGFSVHTFVQPIELADRHSIPVPVYCE